MKFDYQVLHWLNQFAHKSEAFDSVIQMISLNHLLKGAFFIIILWFFWFQKNNSEENRRKIILGLAAAVVTMAVTLVLTRILPGRVRPRFEETLHFLVPGTQTMGGLEDHSSFPSDHASLFFALSTTIFFLHRRLGIFAYLYTVAFICFPRLYLGLHYPTDLIAGGIIGVVTTQFFQRTNVFTKLSTVLVRYEQRTPAMFYCVMFVFCYQVANLFEEFRACLRCAVNLLH